MNEATRQQVEEDAAEKIKRETDKMIQEKKKVSWHQLQHYIRL